MNKLNSDLARKTGDLNRTNRSARKIQYNYVTFSFYFKLTSYKNPTWQKAVNSTQSIFQIWKSNLERIWNKFGTASDLIE